jgi:hypothetical protein
VTSSKLRYCCDECRIESPGWHWIDDGNPEHQPRMVPCPEKQRAEQAAKVAELAAEQKTAATEAARRIVSDAAHRLIEFSANNLRDEIRAAQIVSSGSMGRAFTWAKDQGLIEWTGRMVPSTDPGTNAHRIFQWRSLVYRGRTDYGRTA